MKRFLILAVASGLGLTACASAALPTASRPVGRANPGAVASDPGAATDSKSGTGTSKKPSDSASKGGSGKAEGSKPVACEPLRGGTDGKVAQLVDVRVGTHKGYDRVAFEFAPPSDGQYFGLPPFELRRATPPIREDGSGEPVSVEGSHFATIVFHGGSGVEFTEDGYELTYTGPKVFRPGFRTLAEARRTGDFEATLTWAFGLKNASCWKVHVLENPLRVAIDFPHD